MGLLLALLLGWPASAWPVTKTLLDTNTAQTVSNKTLDSSNTLSAVVLSGTITGTYTLDGTVTLDNPAIVGTVTGTYTIGGTPTISAPILSGSVTGTYTLAGTPTLSGTVAGTPTFSGALTFDGANIHDLDSTTALIVRANSSGTAALTVDTTNTKILVGATSSTHCEVQSAKLGCASGSSLDVLLEREAAAIWQLGTDAGSPTAQLLKAHDGSGTDVAGAALSIGSGRGTGTGVGGALNLQVAYPGTTGSSQNALASIATISGTNNQSSGSASTNSLISLAPTVNQSGTAGYTGLKLNVTETATGSGTKNLLDLQVGGTSKLTVDNTGAISPAALTDIVMVYDATTHCKSDTPSAALVVTRIAKGDWALARTAAGAETYNIVCNLPVPSRSTASKGWKLTAFSIVHQITVAALTSNTFNDLSTVTYANNVANAVADYGGAITITMPTATQANPYVTAGTVGTAAFMNTISGINLDWTAVLQNTGVYRVYSIVATWTEQL